MFSTPRNNTSSLAKTSLGNAGTLTLEEVENFNTAAPKTANANRTVNANKGATPSMMNTLSSMMTKPKEGGRRKSKKSKKAKKATRRRN